MKVKISELEGTMQDLLVRRGLSQQEAVLVASDYLSAEMRGKTTHGVAKFIKELDHMAEDRGKPEVVVDKGSLVLVDANGEIGQLAAMFCADILISRVMKHGIAAVGMRNAKRYGALYPWAEMIARNNFIGIVTNTCEPAGTPYGASSPILGSNPIAIGIPTSQDPIIMDMATTETAMSLIWECMLERKLLPEEIFLTVMETTPEILLRQLRLRYSVGSKDMVYRLPWK